MQERGKTLIESLPRSCKYALFSYVFERGGRRKTEFFQEISPAHFDIT